MDELITLNLTLKELQQIDKYVEINDDTLSVIMKITNAYPQPKSPAEEAYYAVYGWYPPTVGTKCPETKLEVKKMTDTPWLDCMDGFKYSQEPYPDEMFEEAARREAANKAALESLGIDHENFGQKPWDESMLKSTGDFIRNYSKVTRVEVITSNGREFVQYDCSNVQVSIQDDERTLKVFLS